MYVIAVRAFHWPKAPPEAGFEPADDGAWPPALTTQLFIAAVGAFPGAAVCRLHLTDPIVRTGVCQITEKKLRTHLSPQLLILILD